MTYWIESRGGDLALRGAGAVLLLSAWFEGKLLARLVHQGPSQATVAQLALAAVLFLSASLGSALLVLGRHVADRITVSARWTRRY
jgi:hypothetical protein